MKYIAYCDRTFPKRLRSLPDRPEGLYVEGALPLDTMPSAGIVGARNCSAYGRRIAESLAAYLAENGVQVISGMAGGIDGYAHSGALAKNGQTFGVLGCGTDICYPPSNRKLYEAIPVKGGLLSEYEAGTPPLAWHFPLRNRIISGLSDVVIIIEARRKSGSLITADYALAQGKEVLAVPGRVGDALSEGSNYLIAQGAGILWSFEEALKDVQEAFSAQQEAALEEADLPKSWKRMEEPALIRKEVSFSPQQEAILSVLRESPATVEEIGDSADLMPEELQKELIGLLLAGILYEIAPGYYAEK